MAALAVAGPRLVVDDLWTGNEEADEAVFAVLNLDHERFLAEIDLGLGVEEKAEAVAEARSREQGARAAVGAGGDRGDRGDAVSPGVLRARKRLAVDVSRGKGCLVLRASIHALRSDKAAVHGAPERGHGGGTATSAASTIQSAWRRFVLRHVFLHLREVIRQLSASGARAALQAVNPREALLADAASDIVVRFRLARDASGGSALPVVVYKVFTRRPVVDVCRGFCGRLLFCRGAGRAAEARVARAARAATAPELPALCERGCQQCRPRSACCVLFSSYKRVDNNEWRPCPAGLFDPGRCPTRGASRAAMTVRTVRISHGAPATSGLPSSPKTPKRKLSLQEKERVSKIAQLRRLYGYARDLPCPPPPPSLCSKANTFFLVADGEVAAPSASGGGVESVVDDGVGEDRKGTLVGGAFAASPSDAYYDRLLAAWAPQSLQS